MSKLTDLTEQRPASMTRAGRRPRYRRQDYASLVRAAEGSNVDIHDEYRFSGRTFRKRTRI